jgi:hypothetical protein
LFSFFFRLIALPEPKTSTREKENEEEECVMLSVREDDAIELVTLTALTGRVSPPLFKDEVQENKKVCSPLSISIAVSLLFSLDFSVNEWVGKWGWGRWRSPAAIARGFGGWPPFTFFFLFFHRLFLFYFPSLVSPFSPVSPTARTQSSDKSKRRGNEPLVKHRERPRSKFPNNFFVVVLFCFLHTDDFLFIKVLAITLVVFSTTQKKRKGFFNEVIKLTETISSDFFSVLKISKQNKK